MQTSNVNRGDIRSIYSPKSRVQVIFPPGEGRTKQSFKDETDINLIVARFLKTRTLEFTNSNVGRYGDVTGIEYNRAMLLIAGAKSMFNELPAEIRDKFENEPAKFFQFVQNPKNRAECEEMGLLRPEDALAASNKGEAVPTYNFSDNPTAGSAESPSHPRGEKVNEPSTSERVQTPRGDVQERQESQNLRKR